MPYSQSFQAIVLKTYDVGEADRFCILFTKERGRIAARAAGARRLTSKMGSVLLPFRCITVDLKESSGGWIVAGASSDGESLADNLQSFAALEQGIELLLRLVQHEGEIPEVFDAVRGFMSACRTGERHTVLSFSFTLLHILGFLADDEEAEQSLGVPERAFLRACRSGQSSVPDGSCNIRALTQLQTELLEGQLSAPLRAPEIAGIIQ